MRGLFHAFLTLLAFCVYETYAVPNPNQVLNARGPLPSRALNARSPLPSRAYVARAPLPSRAYVARSPQPSRALQARSPQPSAALQARSPRPSNAYYARAPMPSRALEARAPVPSGYSKRSPVEEEQTLMSEEQMIANQLCPHPLTVCPLTSDALPTSIESWIKAGFECVDTTTDLTSCGGCGTVNERYVCPLHHSLHSMVGPYSPRSPSLPYLVVMIAPPSLTPSACLALRVAAVLIPVNRALFGPPMARVACVRIDDNR